MSQTREKLRIVVTDRELEEAGWTNYEYQPIDQKRVRYPVLNSHIAQGAMANCFMLATLGAIAENDQLFLNNRITLSADGKTAEVTFSHGNSDITYVIDATKMSRKIGPLQIIPSDVNQHSHDAVYLLEKAYALHRLYTDQITTEGQFSAEKINKTLQMSGKTIDMVEYRGALSGGTADDVFEALNLPAKTHEIKLEKIENFLEDFSKKIGRLSFQDMWTMKLENGKIVGVFANTKKVADLIRKKIFPDDLPAQEQFLNFLNAFKTDDQFQKLKDFIAEAHKIAKDSNLSVDQLRDQFNALYRDEKYKSLPKMDDALLPKFVDALVARAPHRKRGSGIYSKGEDDLYSDIHTKIKDGHLVTVTTREVIGSKQKRGFLGVGEGLSKGLAANHAYQVVDCFERDNVKFVLVRNPWATEVRGYKEKQTTTGQHALGAESTRQLENHDSDNSFRSKNPVKNSARNLSNEEVKENYSKQGYFELELTDLSKRFDYYYATNAPVVKGIVAGTLGGTQMMTSTEGKVATERRRRPSAAKTGRQPGESHAAIDNPSVLGGASQVEAARREALDKLAKKFTDPTRETQKKETQSAPRNDSPKPYKP